MATQQREHTVTVTATETGTSRSEREGEGTFTVLLFAAAATYANAESLTLSAPMTIQDLFGTLEKRYPGIGGKVLRSAAVTVNLEYVDVDFEGVGDGVHKGDGSDTGGEEVEVLVIKKGDEVGIIPPVSSG